MFILVLLRFLDANNNNEPFNKERINKIMPVDKYVGGIEDACMHLLYAGSYKST